MAWGSAMDDGAGIGVESALSAYLRYVGEVGPLLRVAVLNISPIESSKDEADLTAAFTGMAVVHAACQGIPILARQQVQIERAVFTHALKPRFPNMRAEGLAEGFYDVALGSFEGVLSELAVADAKVRLIFTSIDGPDRGEMFIQCCTELAGALAAAAGTQSDVSSWLEDYTADLQRRYAAAPRIAFGLQARSGPDHA